MSHEYTVSANYLDRQDKEKKWLIREDDQEPINALVCEAVICGETNFTSSTVEIGFGCMIVAKSVTAKAATHEECKNFEKQYPDRLEFTGMNFANAENGAHVNSVKRMALGPDGVIYAEL